MHILHGEDLQPCNTLALAGRAKALVRAGSDKDLVDALGWASERGLPVVPLGEGSNVVIAGDLDALVLCVDTRGMEVLAQDADSVLVRVAAGENWHRFVQWSLQQGYYGLENLALIPGTAGAAPIQNIGAYGVEIAPMVARVHCIAVADGKASILDAQACRFGYRDSVFKHSLLDQRVIRSVELQLSLKPRVQVDYPALAGELQRRGINEPTPQAVFDAVVEIRSSKLPDPALIPNAGSFFKNPVVAGPSARELARRFPGLPQYHQPDGTSKLPAAWLIDHCGWKGYRRAGLGIHPEHALVIVNHGSNDGEALLSLAAEVAESVLATFGIALVIEPRVYGGAL